ncbi:hypothetical protein IE81DRAFT_208959 [Ceraceosorus guamensis]|uniref:Uncharacterized protein n=1 Tax=Ceraceosorus guamensis TaxID=1522189 RepID=A0A316W6I0_9BASI|nr:hypothetical protein IE81DRAFT_208959 [Ceraceosorus guamensis]PWN45234.1 hypothetical protein IE81DRAFT_208959 [Ceraceosorus guamensis]
MWLDHIVPSDHIVSRTPRPAPRIINPVRIKPPPMRSDRATIAHGSSSRQQTPSRSNDAGLQVDGSHQRHDQSSPYEDHVGRAAHFGPMSRSPPPVGSSRAELTASSSAAGGPARNGGSQAGVEGAHYDGPYGPNSSQNFASMHSFSPPPPLGMAAFFAAQAAESPEGANRAPAAELQPVEAAGPVIPRVTVPLRGRALVPPSTPVGSPSTPEKSPGLAHGLGVTPPMTPSPSLQKGKSPMMFIPNRPSRIPVADREARAREGQEKQAAHREDLLAEARRRCAATDAANEAARGKRPSSAMSQASSASSTNGRRSGPALSTAASTESADPVVKQFDAPPTIPSARATRSAAAASSTMAHPAH